MSEAIFTKAEAYPWFRDVALEGLETGGPRNLADTWDAAWQAFDACKGARESQWKGWVRMCVQRAKTKARTSPMGLLLTILNEGPAKPLSATPKTNLHDHRESEWQREQGRREALYDELEGRERLSLVALARAHRNGIDVRALVDTWEEAGYPPQTEIDYPGWAGCLKHAGIRNPQPATPNHPILK